jgi:hypothetical protein
MLKLKKKSTSDLKKKPPIPHKIPKNIGTDKKKKTPNKSPLLIKKTRSASRLNSLDKNKILSKKNSVPSTKIKGILTRRQSIVKNVLDKNLLEKEFPVSPISYKKQQAFINSEDNTLISFLNILP